MNGAAQAVALKKILVHYDADACEQCFEYLESQKWRTTAVSWMTVAREINAWYERTQRKVIPL